MREQDVLYSVRRWVNGLFPALSVYLDRPKPPGPARPYLLVLPGGGELRARCSGHLIRDVSCLVIYCAGNMGAAVAGLDALELALLRRNWFWGYLENYVFDGWVRAEADYTAGSVPAGTYQVRAAARNAAGEYMLPGDPVSVELTGVGRVAVAVGWPPYLVEFPAEYVVYVLDGAGVWREALVLPRPAVGLAEGYIAALPGGNAPVAPDSGVARCYIIRVEGYESQVLQSLDRDEWWDAVVRLRLEVPVRWHKAQPDGIIKTVTVSGTEVS